MDVNGGKRQSFKEIRTLSLFSMAIQFRVKTNHFLLIGVKNAIIQAMNYSIFNFIKNHFLLNVMD